MKQVMLPWAPTVEVCIEYLKVLEPLHLTIFSGQAQYIRVPYADFNALLLPPGQEFEADFILLAGKLFKNGLASLFLSLTKILHRYFPHRYDLETVCPEIDEY